jgi:hypothetical protein
MFSFQLERKTKEMKKEGTMEGRKEEKKSGCH